ncbi:protein of unknown function [Stenotrophomonas maltophilia]|nr:protein of unknown function [Stenotrophomonas maltophilia]
MRRWWIWRLAAMPRWLPTGSQERVKCGLSDPVS